MYKRFIGMKDMRGSVQKWGRRASCAVLLVVIAPLMALGASSDGVMRLSAPDFLRLYPDGLYFEIKRDGEPIGFHRASARREGDVIIIENHTKMKARVFLSLVPYNLDYRATSRWKGETFLSYDAEVEEQGEHKKISLRPQDETGLVLEFNDQSRRITGRALPSPQWLSVYIEGAGLLDGMTGEVTPVTYTELQQSELKTAERAVQARKYQVTGADLEATEWYDRQNRWVAMGFEAPDGSWVDYECFVCGPVEKTEVSFNKER